VRDLGLGAEDVGVDQALQRCPAITKIVEGRRKKAGGERKRGRQKKEENSPHELRWYTNHRRHDIFPKNG
jgi:hypothetical protein